MVNGVEAEADRVELFFTRQAKGKAHDGCSLLPVR
jgi:hypothetical protein